VEKEKPRVVEEREPGNELSRLLGEIVRVTVG